VIPSRQRLIEQEHLRLANQGDLLEEDMVLPTTGDLQIALARPKLPRRQEVVVGPLQIQERLSILKGQRPDAGDGPIKASPRRARALWTG
jgi:hypothetical protein